MWLCGPVGAWLHASGVLLCVVAWLCGGAARAWLLVVCASANVLPLLVSAAKLCTMMVVCVVSGC